MTVNSGVKQANLGGSGGETEFEQAFSSLAYAYLRDKAPRLLDSMVGFQLVDRNEDNTKAIGIFGFQVGSQWLYAPVFFLNGDLKGHELLYVKNNDSFVPLSEEWVNYIMSRKPHLLGEKSERNTFELGGLQPNIRSLSQRPGTGGKIGSAGKRIASLPEAAVDAVMPMLAAFHTKAASSLFPGSEGKLNQKAIAEAPLTAAMLKTAGAFDLEQNLSQSTVLVKLASRICEDFPGVEQHLRSFYGHDCLSRWQKASAQYEKQAASSLLRQPVLSPTTLDPFASLLPPEPAAYKAANLRMYVAEQIDEEQEGDLDEDDRKKLQQDGVLVKDERDSTQVSVAYTTQIAMQLQNPTETALYRVLVKAGEFEKMLVLLNPISSRGRERFTVVVRIEDSGDKGWLNTYADAILADQISEKEEWDKWFDSLSNGTSLAVDGEYVGVSAQGDGVAPFRVCEKLDDGVYKVDFKTYADDAGSRLAELGSTSSFNGSGEYISTYGVKMVVSSEDRQGTKVRILAGEMRVPSTVKFMELSAPPKPRKSDNESLLCCAPAEQETGSERRPIEIGRLDDVQLLLSEKTAQLRIYNNGTEVQLFSPLGRQQLAKRGALLSLVGEHGFSEKVARAMLKEAEASRSATYRVSYAPDYGVKTASPNRSSLEGGPSAPLYDQQLAERGSETYGNRRSVATQYGAESSYGLPELSASRTDPNTWDNWQNYSAEDFRKTVATAQQAGQSGQKEVFDTAMISGMLKSVRQDSLVDKHLGSLVTSLDALGRLIMNFYWHPEEFEDRYGKSDMPELEDSLRNAFEAVGDVTLFLKEKTIESPFEAGSVSIEESARN